MRRRSMLRSQAARIVCRFLTGLVLIAATTGPANAQGRGHPEGWGGGPLLGVPLRALSLTPDPQAQAMTLLSTARTTARRIVQELHQAPNALAEELLGSPSAAAPGPLTAINRLPSPLL